MPVVTVSRQFGSGGDEVAVEVARRLRLQIVGREIINQAALLAGAPEIALAEIDDLGLLDIKPSQADSRRYAEMITQIIRERAAEGQVLFLGRGAQTILADWPGVLRVRVMAPLEVRIEHVQKQNGLPHHIAAALVEARDQARASYVEKYFGQEPNDPAFYDLVLNLARLSITAAAELVGQAVKYMRNMASEALP